MEWLRVLAIILGNAGFIIPLFLWNRAESIADYRHIESVTTSQIREIQEEIKDFHERLCAIEERRVK